MTRHHHNLLREGFVAGALGAAAVAVWFLLTDLLQGQPLATPNILGQVVLFQNTAPEPVPIQAAAVVGYSLLHIGAFVLFGIVATEFVHLAMSSPLARFGILVIAVCFELFFVFMSYAVFSAVTTYLPWWSILVANALALTAMGVYLMRKHRGLTRQFAREPLGA
jgi:hypothetical protein